MSDSDVPAGQAGGRSNVSDVSGLPARIRVHALAKLIEVTSREVLDALGQLGSPARGVQSNIDRAAALRVIEALAPGKPLSALIAEGAPETAESRPWTSPSASTETRTPTDAPASTEAEVSEPADISGAPAVTEPSGATESAGVRPAVTGPAEASEPAVVGETAASEPADGERVAREPAVVGETAVGEPAVSGPEALSAGQAPVSGEVPTAAEPRSPTAAQPDTRVAQPDTPAAPVAPPAAPVASAPDTPSSTPVAGPPPNDALPLFAAASPMFLPPEPVSAPPAPRAGAEDEPAGAGEPAVEEGGESKRRRRRGRRGRGRGRGTEDLEESASLDTEDQAGEAEDRDERRVDERGSGTGAELDQVGEDTDLETGEDTDLETGEDTGEEGLEEVSPTRRRRRRRRRRDSADGVEADERDPDEVTGTVTRIREPRKAENGDPADSGAIQGVRGSTRLEAKRQRRRDGRDAGRRRAPVLSEAEFLARRESVQRTMVVRQHGERSEIGVLEDGVLVEHFVTSSGGSSLVGNVYLGRVQNVLPSMEAAFVDIGRGRNAVLYAGEVDWDAAGLAGKARRIEQALSSGDSILVQVTKDPVGHKGARLTTQISLPGRFLVYVPSGGTHGISRKLPDTERRRLKDLLKEIVPEDAGVIIRTASEGVSQQALERDVRRLQAQWEVVRNKAEAAKSGKSKGPELLYEEPDLMIKVVRDQFNEDFAKLVVQGDDAWDTLHAYVSHVAPELADRLHRHVGPSDVFSEYRIDEQLLKALDRKVWLPSGGTLVIERTEAMTVIDVNTGKFTGSGGNLEETVTRNNLEAAEEIVRQLRLRDIGGIIVIDFIDMVLESNRDLVLRRLTECLGRDRTRHQVAEVTTLGLVQMTRKRVGMGLLEAFSTLCEHCRGRGVIVSSEPVEPKAEHGPVTGRRRSRGEARANGQQRPPVEAPAPNGRPVPTPPRPSAPPVRAASPAPVAPPAPVDPARAEPGPVESGQPEQIAEPLAASAHADAAPVVDVTPAAPAGAELPLPSPPSPVPDPASPGFSPPEQAAEPTEHTPSEQPVRPEGRETVAVGAASEQVARPARRRRRVASRPAGPPSAGGAGADPV